MKAFLQLADPKICFETTFMMQSFVKFC